MKLKKYITSLFALASAIFMTSCGDKPSTEDETLTEQENNV